MTPIITCLLFIFSVGTRKAQFLIVTLLRTIEEQENTILRVTNRAAHIPSETSYVTTSNEYWRFTIEHMGSNSLKQLK
ncbi:hypothetical protein [Pedobacter jejuensis]|uniref:hypothetical protein n=1 Tax=Pedobacter jejuensis TaxID=1268550 RepID=UPI0011CED0D7|nr:hypothetical protein [Pedobacter jejuensis]